MLSYAVDDVRHLLEIADHYQDQLRSKNRMHWFVQSCDDLRDGVAARSTEPKEDPWRLQGSGKLHPKGLALMRGLWLWREGIAEERDVPCFRIISNKQIIEVATMFEHGDMPHPPGGWRPKWKRDFEMIIEQVLATPEAEWPQRVKFTGSRMSQTARDQLDLLCQHRETLGHSLDLEPSLLGARASLELVVNDPEGIKDLLPWQCEVLGDLLVKTRQALGFDGVAGTEDQAQAE
jgi:ribonuclease D